jgi:hypothetical protein
VPIQAVRLVPLLLVLGAVYGAFMGLFALMNRADPAPMQLVAAVVKVPALFMLTLLVTFPSLYVFNALVGSRLTPVSLMRMLIASLGVTLAVLSSLGPIVGFFSLTSENYSFMIVFNVVVFAASGVRGLLFRARTLSRVSLVEAPAPPPPSPVAEGAVVLDDDAQAGPLDGEGPVLGPHVKKVFAVWMLVFGLVGGQMAWVLRPFIGNPDQPFTWFRPRESSFFQAVWSAVQNLFS